MKKEGVRQVYQEWLEKAEEDLEVVDVILREDAPLSVACFHAQQAAEKFLKALLAYREKAVRKIHDLVRLGRMIEETDSGIGEYRNDLALLNRFYIRTRYPAHTPEFSKRDAMGAVDAAKRIAAFVRACIG